MRFRQRVPRRLTVRTATLPFVALTVFTTFACSLDKLTQPQGPGTEFNFAVAGDTTVSIGSSATMSITTPTGPLAASTAVVTWSSDQPAIAAVDATTGVVTGAAIGQATISATVVAPEIGEVTATARQVRVKYAGIRITTVDSLIAIGMTKVVTVRGTNAAGTLLATIPFSTAMQVVSRDVNIFDVNASGALVAKANGTARLFVQHDGNKDSVNVKVRQVTRSITFPGAVANELPIGSINRDRTLAITARDSLGVAIAAPTVTWGTSDATTVTVGAATGVARGLKLGTATITATSDGLSAPILARVTQIPATLTKLAGDALSATVGEATSTPPRVAVLDSGNTPIPGVAVSFTVASGGGS
ncbi:MAG: Ig-like domain-containing protein, partial [Gemmatimonadaceae bacterium]